jgi:hypothetical protein
MIALALALIALHGEKPMDGAVIAINYSRGVGWSGTEALELVRKGESTMLLTFNHEGPAQIGVWKHALPETRFDQVLARLRASGYEKLPAPAAVPPGTSVVSIGERRTNETMPKMRGFAPLPPALADVTRAFAEVIAELRAHPARVLSGRAHVKASELKRGEPLAVEVTLTNAGTQPLELSNPLHDPGGWNGLRVVISPAGADEVQVDVRAADIRAPESAPRTPTAALPPGASLSFEVRAAVSAPPGKHRARLEIHSVNTKEGDPQFVGGTLALDLGTLTVRRGPWWRFGR